MWDVTCIDAFAPTHVSSVCIKARGGALRAEVRKKEKYAGLGHTHISAPVALETLGNIWSETRSLLKELGQWLYQVPGELKTHRCLLQCLSCANPLWDLGNITFYCCTSFASIKSFAWWVTQIDGELHKLIIESTYDVLNHTHWWHFIAPLPWLTAPWSFHWYM